MDSDEGVAPEDQKPHTILVLAAVLRRGERYLVGKRPARKRHGGLWEFPGGKVEAGEDLEEAAARELREELGLQARRVGRRLGDVRDPGSPFLIRFVEVEADGDPQSLEHQELRWVTLDELRSLPLAPSDRTFLERLSGPG